MHEPKQVGAFFDFDGTLIKEDSEHLLYQYLWRTGNVSARFLLTMRFAYLLYLIRLYPESEMLRLACRVYAGQPIEKFTEIGRAFYQEELKPRFSKRMIRLLEKHKEQGHDVILLSASFRFYLCFAAEDLGMDHLVCSDLETGRDGHLTGRPGGARVRGEQKAVAARALAKKAGIDLERSYAYGDHITDRSILELVGHPVAVEPSFRLRRLARKNAWPVVRLEKQVDIT